VKRSMEASSSEATPWSYGFISILLLGLVLAVSFHVTSLLDVYAFPYALLPSAKGSALFAIVHALPAAVGMWWGKRREEVDFSPHPVGPGGNASSSEEPVTPARGDARDTGGSQS
jgi:hypothetical protein